MPSDVLLDVDVKLEKIERQLRSLFSRTYDINIGVSPQSVAKIQGQVQSIFSRSSIKLTNIDIAGTVARGIKTGLQTALNKGPLYINDVRLGRGAAQSLRNSVQQAMSGVSVGAGGRGGGSGNNRVPGRGPNLPLGRINGDLSEFDRSLDAATARVTAFGGVAVVIYGIKRALDELVLSTIEVDKALREVNVLLNLTDSDLQKFGANLFSIARQTATSFQDVSAAAVEFSRQGLNAEETLQRVAAAQSLVRLSGIDSVKAVEGLTTALNSYVKEGLSAIEVTDKLAAVDAVAATSAGGLAEGVSRVGSAAADAGVQFDDLLALIASAKQITGRSEAVIGNAFKTIFTRLDRSKVREVLGDVIDIEDGDGAVEILQKLAKNYDNLSRTQQAYVAEITAGVFQINQFKAIISDLGSEFSIFDRAQKAAANSTGISDKRIKELTQSLSDLLQIAGTNVKQGLAGIGNELFAEQLRGGLKTFNLTAELLQNSDPEGLGVQLGKAILKGIGSVITGPAAFAGLAIGFRLIRQVSTFLLQNTSTLLGLEQARLAVAQQTTAQLQAQGVAVGRQAAATGAIVAGGGARRGLSNSRLLGIGFGATLAGSGAASLIGEETAGARQGSAISRGVGNIAGLGLTGGAIGGPAGAILGSTIGLLASFDDILTSFVSDLPDVKKRFDSVTDNLNKFNVLTESVLTLQSNYDGLANDVKNGSATQKQLNRAQQKLVKEVAKLPADIRARFQGASTFNEKRSILNEEGARQQQLTGIQGQALSFSSLFEGQAKNKFYSQIAQGFYTALGATPIGFASNLLQGGGANPFENATNQVRGLGGFKSLTDGDNASKLKEIANSLVESSADTVEGLKSIDKELMTTGNILSIFGIKADTDLGRFINKLQGSPDAIQFFIESLRQSAQSLAQSLKESEEDIKKNAKKERKLTLPESAFLGNKSANEGLSTLSALAASIQESVLTLQNVPAAKAGDPNGFLNSVTRSAARKQQGINDQQLFNLLGLDVEQQQTLQGKYFNSQEAARQGALENRIKAGGITQQGIGGVLQGASLTGVSSPQLQSQIDAAIQNAVKSGNFDQVFDIQKRLGKDKSLVGPEGKNIIDTVNKYLEAFVLSATTQKPQTGALGDVVKAMQQNIQVANIDAANATISIQNADKQTIASLPLLNLPTPPPASPSFSFTNPLGTQSQSLRGPQSFSPPPLAIPDFLININVQSQEGQEEKEKAQQLTQRIQDLAIQATKEVYGDRIATLERKTNTPPPAPTVVTVPKANKL